MLALGQIDKDELERDPFLVQYRGCALGASGKRVAVEGQNHFWRGMNSSGSSRLCPWE